MHVRNLFNYRILMTQFAKNRCANWHIWMGWMMVHLLPHLLQLWLQVQLYEVAAEEEELLWEVHML